MSAVTRYRVSVTTLEKFRRFMDGVSRFDTEEALLQAIKGEFTGTPKTKVGNAFHTLIEEPKKMRSITLADGGTWWAVPGTKKDPEIIAFKHEHATIAGNYHRQLRGMIYEVPVRKNYPAGNGVELTVTGRIDGSHGRKVRDIKTRFKPLDSISDYMESCQGKFYLDILQVPVMYYDVFEIEGMEDYLPLPYQVTRPEGGEDPMHFMDRINVIPHDPIPSTRFMSLYDYLVHLCRQFMEYIQNRNFHHYLKQVDEYNNIAGSNPAWQNLPILPSAQRTGG